MENKEMRMVTDDREILKAEILKLLDETPLEPTTILYFIR